MTPVFGSLAASATRILSSVMFRNGPCNLPFPSAWRVTFDGVTIKNGATVLFVLIVFASERGEIESVLIDVVVSKGGSGPAVARVVFSVLQEHLRIEDKDARCTSTIGLPFAIPRVARRRNQCS